jgi:hypothetical protein
VAVTAEILKGGFSFIFQDASSLFGLEVLPAWKCGPSLRWKADSVGMADDLSNTVVYDGASERDREGHPYRVSFHGWRSHDRIWLRFKFREFGRRVVAVHLGELG